MKFVTFEGVDGSGKSTQATMVRSVLAERLRPRGVLLVHDPGGTVIGDRLRAVLLDPEHTSMTVPAEVLLYVASRAQLVAEIIRPAIERGELVISDRYFDATLAYQGCGRGVDMRLLEEMHRFSTGGLLPDLTFVLDVDPSLGHERIESGRGRIGHRATDRMEGEGLEFARRVRQGYRELARAQPGRIRVVDGSRPVEVVFEEIDAELRAHGL